MTMAAHTAEAFFSRWKLDRTNGVPLHVQIERLRRRTSFDAKDRPIDYAEIHYNTAAICLTLSSRWEPLD